MKMCDPMPPEIDRAVEALKTVLHQSSAVKLKDIDILPMGRGRKADILAHVDVYGHAHTLVCKLIAGGESHSIRENAVKLCEHVAQLSCDATLVFIAHRYSANTLALCREIHAGLLDLDGNARIELGEVFIARQLSPRVDTHRTVRPRLSPARAEVMPTAPSAVA